MLILHLKFPHLNARWSEKMHIEAATLLKVKGSRSDYTEQDYLVCHLP